jgi:RNA polymerase sigma factor (sigma-70 family)
MSTSILALTHGVALGDHACFDALHGRWSPVVRAWIAKTIPRSMHEAHAGDIEQEVWIRVIRRLRAMESEVRFERWLRSVTLNAARDRLRHEFRRTRRERVVRSARSGAASAGADEGLIARERVAGLMKAMRDIDAETARLIDLRMRTDATLDRLGGLVGLSPGALDGRVRRALKGLRDRAEPEEPPPRAGPIVVLPAARTESTATLNESRTRATTGGQ